MQRAAIYCRVSTESQTIENQRLAISRYCETQGWKLVREYQDVGVSGAQEQRDGLDRLKDDAAGGRFDVLVVWKFDRLARSTSHLLSILELLRKHKVAFVSVSEAVDTSTAAGKMVMTFLGSIAEFERSLIVERVNCGLARAKAQGKTLGRPRRGFDIHAAVAMRNEGLGYKQIAARLGVPRTTIFRYLAHLPSVTAGIPKTPETVSA